MVSLFNNRRGFFANIPPKRWAAFVLICGLITSSGFTLSSSVAKAQTIDFRTSEEIKNLNQQITDKSDLIDNLSDKAEEYAMIIQQKQEEANSLENEISIIENRVAKLNLDVEKKDAEIDKTNLKMRETDLQISDNENKIGFQEVQLAALLRDIHRQDQRSQLEILMSNDTLSKYFSYVKGLTDIQSSMQVTLAGVKDSKRELEIYNHSLEVDKADLQNLLLELEIEEQKLEEEKDGKVRLISETEMSEVEFQNSLSEIRFQQRIANESINLLEHEIKEKLRQAQFDNPNLIINPGQLLWPVPNQGITTYFHDPTYPYAHIVGPHSGLDIRTLIDGSPSMGLTLRAPAAGIVVKTIHNGRYTGNAVYISHGDIMTVFLHLSAIYVQEDDFVAIGQTIGLTGGAPGHPGAGLSSGPHLHFEVRQNGIPVDPCAYLVPSC